MVIALLLALEWPESTLSSTLLDTLSVMLISQLIHIQACSVNLAFYLPASVCLSVFVLDIMLCSTVGDQWHRIVVYTLLCFFELLMSTHILSSNPKKQIGISSRVLFLFFSIFLFVCSSGACLSGYTFIHTWKKKSFILRCFVTPTCFYGHSWQFSFCYYCLSLD